MNAIQFAASIQAMTKGHDVLPAGVKYLLGKVPAEDPLTVIAAIDQYHNHFVDDIEAWTDTACQALEKILGRDHELVADLAAMSWAACERKMELCIDAEESAQYDASYRDGSAD